MYACLDFTGYTGDFDGFRLFVLPPQSSGIHDLLDGKRKAGRG